MLNSLETRGYIKRIEKTKNKRQAHIITLTEKGSETLTELTNIIIPMFETVHKKMENYDIEYLKKGIEKLRKSMSEIIEITI